MSVTITEAHMESFKKVTSKKYAVSIFSLSLFYLILLFFPRKKDQGKFFLNAFWKELSGEAENVWKW